MGQENILSVTGLIRNLVEETPLAGVLSDDMLYRVACLTEPDAEDGLLSVQYSGGSPTVVQYNLPKLFAKALAIVGGVAGAASGYLAAIALAVVVLEYADVRRRLRPAAAMVVWLLVETPNRSLARSALRDGFNKRFAEVAGGNTTSTEFDVALALLEETNIVANDGDCVTLHERCVVTVSS